MILDDRRVPLSALWLLVDVLTEIGESSAVSVLAVHGELTRIRSLDADIDSAAFAKAGSDVGVKVESGKDGDKTTVT